LGSLFVIRMAGNVIDDLALGSIEYGAHHLGCPLIVVLGHQFCGAVKATNESLGNIEGDNAVATILKEIWPCCKYPAVVGKQNTQIDLDAKIQRNIRHAKKKILQSEIIEHLIQEKKLDIILAEYYLDTGKVCEISDALRDEKKLCYGDTVTLKNVDTGTFLCSPPLGQSEEGEGQPVTLSWEINEDAQWILASPVNSAHFVKGNPISEADFVRLLHKNSNKFLQLHNNTEPSVSCVDEETFEWEISMKLGEKSPSFSLRYSTPFSLKDPSCNFFLDVTDSSVSVKEISKTEGDSIVSPTFWVIEQTEN